MVFSEYKLETGCFCKMGKRGKYKSTPKLWKRVNRRLHRRNLLEDPEYPSQTTTSSCVDDNNGCSGYKLIPFNVCGKKYVDILDLPEECLIIILRNLTFHEICNVSRVCKRLYQMSWNTTLWNSVDLSSVYAIPISSMDFSQPSQMMTFPKRRMLLASFLGARRAVLTDIRGEANICRESNMCIRLLHCNVRNLQTVRLRLPYGMNYLTYSPNADETLALQDVLRCLVRNCSSILKSLKCYVDISYTTADLLASLHGLEYLNLQFLSASCQRRNTRNGPPEYLQPKAVEAIFSLPNLKYLKISICQNSYTIRYFQGYILKSDTLETLDFGWTKQFFIRELILPKLHTIKAESLHNFRDSQRAVCLFDLIERGCPQIQTLNHYTSLLPGLQNFNLSNEQKRGLYLCVCPSHAPPRVYH